MVKNVTGYDLCKLFAGAYGTLGGADRAVGEGAAAAGDGVHRAAAGAGRRNAAWQPVLAECLNSPHEVSAPPTCRAPSRARSRVAASRRGGRRHRGSARSKVHAPSVAYRADAIDEIVRGAGGVEQPGSGGQCAVLWREIGDAALLAEPAARAIWRVSLDALRRAGVRRSGRASRPRGTRCSTGAAAWSGSRSAPTKPARTRAQRWCARRCGARRWACHTDRAPDAVRASVAVFEPLAGPLAALTRG